MEPSLQKISKNPFYHLKNGVGRLFNTNTSALIGTFFINLIVYALCMVGVIMVFLYAFGEAKSGAEPNLLFLALAYFVALLVMAIPFLALDRIILTGARSQKSGVKEAFSVALSRLGTGVVAFILAMLVYFVVALITGGIGAAVGPAAGLLAVVLVPLVIIILIRLSFVAFILVDDEKPESAIYLFKQSNNLAKHSVGALVLFYSMSFGVMLLFQVLLGLAGGSNSGGSELQYNIFLMVGSGIATLLISMLIGVAIQAGIANIYNEVKRKSSSGNPQNINTTTQIHTETVQQFQANSVQQPTASPQISAQPPSTAPTQTPSQPSLQTPQAPPQNPDAN